MSTSVESTDFFGFPAGNLKATVIPNLFFSALLPAIDDLYELKVILHVFWRVQEKRGRARFVTFGEMAAESARSDLVAHGDLPSAEVVRAALAKAVERRVLLQVEARFPDRSEDVFFINSAEGRRAVEQLRLGEIDIGQVLVEPVAPKITRTPRSIFSLYEQNIGLLTPLLAEQLQDAEKLYPAEWIEEAFQLAVEYNKRNWRYVHRILERWASEGRSNAGRRR